ncbi:MAG: flavodoxin domain-containing protein [Candidatus Bathyarchaeota archaeon]|nr:flavodoxin domain-containing protein [Candidatus Bathyarchaeota archaeon]
MMKVFVVYDSKHGNTKLVAERIVEGIREVGGLETAIADVKRVHLEDVVDSDAVLIGSPNHFDGPARGIDAFIDKLGKIEKKVKWVAVFDTHLAEDKGAHTKMEQRIGEKVPDLKLITPSLSVKVEGIKGPISEGELPRCVDFGREIATQLKM